MLAQGVVKPAPANLIRTDHAPAARSWNGDAPFPAERAGVAPRRRGRKIGRGPRRGSADDLLNGTMNRIRTILLVGLLAAWGTACSPAYVMRAAWEEAKILNRRKPIARIVADTATDWETRDKLMLVLQARQFAADSLRLNAGDSYTLFSRVESDTLVMVLSAAPKDQFRPHTWWFPIVGSVPYKGFFDPADAEKEQRRLEARGYDTFLRPSAAFSTLGWFNDPLLSTLLRYDRISLANTVIHEIFHNTFYAPGQAVFNESLANFVGGRGAIEFFCRRDGPDAATCRNAVAMWEDDLLFGAFMEALVEEVKALYARTDLTTEDKLRERERLFADAQRRFAEEVRPRLQVDTFASFTSVPLNNATLISRHIYYDRLSLFEEVYRSRGGDFMRAMNDIVAAARGNKADPYAAVQALVTPAGGG
jgi:predicted aminopeptidase